MARASGLIDAVTTLLTELKPKVTPFEFENVIAERLALVVPAEKFQFVRSVWLPLEFVGNHTVWFVVCAATRSSSPPELMNACVTVEASESPTSHVGPKK